MQELGKLGKKVKDEHIKTTTKQVANTTMREYLRRKIINGEYTRANEYNVDWSPLDNVEEIPYEHLEGGDDDGIHKVYNHLLSGLLMDRLPEDERSTRRSGDFSRISSTEFNKLPIYIINAHSSIAISVVLQNQGEHTKPDETPIVCLLYTSPSPRD